MTTAIRLEVVHFESIEHRARGTERWRGLVAGESCSAPIFDATIARTLGAVLKHASDMERAVKELGLAR